MSKAQQKMLITQRQELDQLTKQALPFLIDLQPWDPMSNTEFQMAVEQLKNDQTLDDMLREGFITHVQDTQYCKVTLTSCMSGRTREFTQQLQQATQRLGLNISVNQRQGPSLKNLKRATRLAYELLIEPILSNEGINPSEQLWTIPPRSVQAPQWSHVYLHNGKEYPLITATKGTLPTGAEIVIITFCSVLDIEDEEWNLEEYEEAFHNILVPALEQLEGYPFIMEYDVTQDPLTLDRVLSTPTPSSSAKGATPKRKGGKSKGKGKRTQSPSKGKGSGKGKRGYRYSK